MITESLNTLSPTLDHCTCFFLSSASAICKRKYARGRRWSLEKIVRRPETIERTRPLGIQSQPWLSLPTPMQQTDRTRMQIPAKPLQIISSKPVLIPPVLDPSHITCKNQEKRRERTQFVNPNPLLYSHPLFELLRVAALPPPLDVDHHHPSVEIARLPAAKRPGKARVRPELAGEVAGEIGMAVLGRPEDMGAEIYRPELGHVVYDDEIRVEVDDPSDPRWEEIREVDPSVVEGLIEGSANGGGDLALDEIAVEVVEAEVEVREGVEDGVAELGAAVGGEEVEDDVFRAGGVLEDGEDAGDGAAEVEGVEGHGDVDDGGVVGVAVERRPDDIGAAAAVTESRGFSEYRELGSCRHRSAAATCCREKQ
ncbi:hypothetical protein MRB53_029726 [Persea americana]|uniref:Uncharacterized protein n=1 Tax=Persea americana TaxID=3435 RepID=A0ACC2KKA4_PERAE|nr:hypothetical protein MRB53_029726 [Persea americana]